MEYIPRINIYPSKLIAKKLLSVIMLHFSLLALVSCNSGGGDEALEDNLGIESSSSSGTSSGNVTVTGGLDFFSAQNVSTNTSGTSTMKVIARNSSNLPLAGVTVTFTLNDSTGGSLSATSATTGSDGIAHTIFTAPGAVESPIISAVSSIGTATFFITVGSSNSGAGAISYPALDFDGIITATTLDSSSIKLTFPNPNGGSGLYTYRVYSQGSYTSPIATFSSNQIIVENGVNTFTYSNLTASTLYNLVIRVYDALAGEEEDNTAAASATTQAAIASFAGITSIDLITRSSMRLNWSAHADANSYLVQDMTSGSAVMVATVANSQTNYTIASLTPSTSHTYRIRYLDSSAQQDNNTNTAQATALDPLTFGGLDAISTYTNATVDLAWTHVADASSYQVFSVSGGTLNYIATVTAPTATYTASGLTGGTAYTFRVTAFDSEAISDINGNTYDKNVTTSTAPAKPNGLTLTTPSTASNFLDTPTITVSGVTSGDTVKLFTDNTCSTQVGSAVSAGSSVAVTTSSLAAGDYDFYATATATNPSLCSTATLAYTHIECPTNYIEVPKNVTVGAPDDFCVMKYEAKNDGSGDAISNAGTIVWVSINQTTAKTECTDLNALNGVTSKYDLISNPEWMAIARNVENVPGNWTNGAIGSGCLKRGNVGSTLNCAGGDSAYNGSDPEIGSGRNALASLTLDNGEVIWDFSGNVWEWTDWTLGGALSTNMSQGNKASQAGTPVASWIEWTATAALTATMPAESILPDDPAFNSSYGVGQYYAATSGGAARRGGNWGSGASAGAFALILHLSSSGASPNIGFRCVFRP